MPHDHTRKTERRGHMNRSEISSRRRCGIIILAVLIAATLAFIWSNSSDSPEDTHEKSDGIVEILKPILDPFDLVSDEDFSFLIRKAAHFSEYALLGAELFVMRRRTSRRALYRRHRRNYTDIFRSDLEYGRCHHRLFRRTCRHTVHIHMSAYI